MNKRLIAATPQEVSSEVLQRWHHRRRGALDRRFSVPISDIAVHRARLLKAAAEPRHNYCRTPPTRNLSPSFFAPYIGRMRLPSIPPAAKC